MIGDFVMLKRFLFVLLLLGFVVSVPYELDAAPKKETRKERRERLKREREEKRKQRQQKNTQQSKHPQKKKRSSKQDTQPAKQPQPKKIIPTFEEKLTPAQVNRKIQTIRRRIETAPEDRISTKNKKVLLDVFDDMAQTQMGRYIFEKAHPNLIFRVEQTGSGVNGSYSYDNQCVNLGNRVFEDIHNAKTPEKRLYELLYIAHVIAHETTHSIQHSNNMNNSSNMSFEEMITINKLFELHSILNENIVRYQIGNLAKYRHMIPETRPYRSEEETEPGKVSVVPMHLFYKELKEAKMATGADEKTAERFARTKFVESFWQNNGKTSIQVGNKTILPTTSRVAEVMQNWNTTYNLTAFGRLIGDKRPYRQAMTDVGINKNIQHFVDAMGIDTSPSFFRDPKTTSFKMQTSKRFIAYTDGVKRMELDALTTGYVIKIYAQKRLSRIVVSSTQKQEAQKNTTRIEYHDGTQINRASYTYNNGKMNGIYREYDEQGRQTMEMPVVNDVPNGEGWILENGVRARKKFFNYSVLKIKERD